MGKLLGSSLIFALAMKTAMSQLLEEISRDPTATPVTSSISATSSSTSSNNRDQVPALTIFPSNWTIPDQALDSSPQPIIFDYAPPLASWTENLTLVLCQTYTSDFASINSVCSSPGSCSYDYLPRSNLTSYWSFVPVNTSGIYLDNFFFCFGIFASDPVTSFQCASSSPLFNISQQGLDAANSKRLIVQETSTQMTVVSITQNKEIIYYVGGPVPAIITSTVGTTYAATPTGASTALPTATQISTPANTKASTGKSSLSVGAKVGISLGALALVAALLLALFFLRRKHSKRATKHHQPEQVMLTRSMHTDSFGRPNLITEKEEASSSAAALNLSGDSPIHTTNGGILVGAGGETNHLTPTLSHNQPQQPQTRHTVLSPYEPLPSAPYTGTIGTASSIPRRKPTAAAMASTVSRELSTASSVSVDPISPHSARTGPGTTPSGGSDEFEAYNNVPVYGDARHVPQAYSGGGGGVPRSRAPFLSEETEGMTPEEVARLEEEERRIDLAIAEAERR